MARSLSHKVLDQGVGMRLDAGLASLGCFPSRSAAVKALEEERVLVNGCVENKKYLLQQGDMIIYTLSDETPQVELFGEPIDLDIRYEDQDILVISKQPDLVCHPSADHFDGTLVNALIYHCGAENLCNVQGEFDRLGIVHRLDRDTSGLMLCAKTNEAGQILMDDIRDRIVDRHYLCLVQGVIPHDTGMIDAPIARHPQDRLRMCVRDGAGSREALTSFTVLERFDPGVHDEGFTLLDCKLFTGRTHQIRVHMNYIKHACVGDPVYGTGNDKMQLGLTRQFLHSYRLRFNHPISKQELSFTDSLPSDLQRALDTLQDRSQGRTQARLSLLEDLS